MTSTTAKLGEMGVDSQKTTPVRVEGQAAFGKYTLIAKIGHGGMAEVFLAANQGPAGFTKLAVLKRLHPHLEEEELLLEMFLDEARLAARLNHPHVVQTYEVGEVDAQHYIAMEHLEGQSLARVLRHARKQGQPLPLSLAVRVFIDVLDGLHYAHTLRDFDGTPLGVVHRDISPGNLFVTYEGQVKILDFGIAKAGTQLSETRAGQVKGKFAYIAPEQARPGGHDHRADLWSMGVVMWEALSGRRLFKGESEVLTLHNTLNSEVVALDEEMVPPELAAIVDRSLQRDPAARYQSAREMKEDLEVFMHRAGLRASRSDLGAFVIGLFERERDEQRRVLKAYMAGERPGQPLAASGAGVISSSGSHSGVKGVSESLIPPVQSGEIVEGRGGRVVLALILLLSVALGGLLAAMWVARSQPEGPMAGGESQSSLPPSDPPPPSRPTPQEPAESLADEDAQRGGAEEAEGERGDGLPSSDERTSSERRPDEPRPNEQPERTTMRRRPGMRATGMRPVSAPMEEETAMGMATPATEYGFLTLDSVPWSQVSLGAERLGTTPILRHRLPAGTHTLTLVNPERGLRQRYRVIVRPGETTRRRVGLE